ncbi:MAG: 50S ribosomal protein L22 [Actinobacteria bacterium]|nr:50S ribosomal protein L22 [Actinomycetota bacterium]
MATVEAPRTEVRAQARYVRTAPRKAQLVADQIRGRTVPEARTILAFMSRDAARDLEKVLNSAVANAEANHGLAGDELVISAAYVGAGPTLKRWRARARGRVARIRKRTCHITINLAQPDGSALPEARAPLAATVTPEAPVEGAKPKRASRKKPEVAETTEVAEAAEEKPKTRPKRAQKPKAEEPKAKEKPKRTRAAKPKADADEEKPKRTPRKKADEGGES